MTAPQYVQELSIPAARAVAVTPNDSADLASYTRALYIGVSGNLVVDMVDQGSPITFTAVPVGILPIRVKRVRSTSTTATNIVALW
jgi:hypothetical protein